MYRRPPFSEYVMARLITIAIFTTIIYTLLVVLIPEAYQTITFHIILFFFAQIIFLTSLLSVSRRVEKELKDVENYLSGIEKLEKLNSSAHFFTREFENINLKLIQILRKVKRREKEKRKYTAKIKLKNQQRSDMLSAIAHEFRNPIAAIMGYAQTLTDDDEIPPSLRKKFLNKIYNNGDKIEELLSRLLLWNRFESGNQKLKLSKFDIQPLVKEIALNLGDKYPTREIRVKEGKLFVKADKALIEIVLKNLIENALKYSNELITINLLKNKINIIDRGVGISEKNIEKVTKKFFRTDEHSWDNSMGLGLAIVKQILKLHNTVLEIQSEENKGSTFSFAL